MTSGNRTSHDDIWEGREKVRGDVRARAIESLHANLPQAIELIRAAGCTEAWLVGSFARNEPRDSSDVDLVVRGLSPSRRADLWWNLGRLFGREVDLVEMERIDPERLSSLLHLGARLFP